MKKINFAFVATSIFDYFFFSAICYAFILLGYVVGCGKEPPKDMQLGLLFFSMVMNAVWVWANKIMDVLKILEKPKNSISAQQTKIETVP